MEQRDVRPDPILRAKLLIAALRIEASEQADRALLSFGTRLTQWGRRALLAPHRNEKVGLPPTLEVGGVLVDVIADLVSYTGLNQTVVERLIQRQIESFRTEWYARPSELRSDSWYYRASSAYLFGNAVHVHEDPGILSTLEAIARQGTALDFGGGSGNLALALVQAGWLADHLERSALQKDFVRFRASRYGVESRLRVLDDWQPLEPDRYDLVVALDVFEHLPSLASVLDRLLPSVKAGGTLFESSPFVRNLSNPMHYEHRELDSALSRRGFVLVQTTPHGRAWRRAQ